MSELTLVSHHLCPYVQRAVISLSEKAVPHTRRYIDLGNKPAWFSRMSPTGKVPLLLVTDESSQHVLFESAAIIEYLEDIGPARLHPEDALRRAQHRAWIEFGSGVLNRIAAFYNADSEAKLASESNKLSAMFSRLEDTLEDGPYFSGPDFSLVDAVFGPIFRYFDTFDKISDFGILDGMARTRAWRKKLAERESIRHAVSDDYGVRLRQFLINRRSALSFMIPTR